MCRKFYHYLPNKNYGLLKRICSLRTAGYTAVFFLIFGCSDAENENLFLFKPHAELEKDISHPIKHISSHNFEPELAAAQRLKDPEGLIIKTWKEWDECAEYRPYAPTAYETNLIAGVFSNLPPVLLTLLASNLTGYYFIENFIGTGLTDWILDEQGNVFCYIIFNSKVLSENLNETLTRREMSGYSDTENNPDTAVRVVMSDVVSGFHYVLLHETGHVYDYSKRITPYVEPVCRFFPGHDALTKKPSGFSSDVWSSEYKTPRQEYDFHLRKSLRYYGLGGSSVSITNAAALYRSLSHSPFCSLYGSVNWAEDFTECLTFFYLTRILALPYRIELAFNGEVIMSVTPAETKMVRTRMVKAEQYFTRLYSSD